MHNSGLTILINTNSFYYPGITHTGCWHVFTYNCLFRWKRLNMQAGQKYELNTTTSCGVVWLCTVISHIYEYLWLRLTIFDEAWQFLYSFWKINQMMKKNEDGDRFIFRHGRCSLLHMLHMYIEFSLSLSLFEFINIGGVHVARVRWKSHKVQI